MRLILERAIAAMTSTGWNLSGQEQYDVSRLVPDTLALLTPSAPVLLRMETLRRATLYGQQRTAVTKELLLRLERELGKSEGRAGGV